MPLAAFLFLAAAAPAAAQDGRATFQARCASCHSTEADAPERPGPNLGGLIGRVVGGDPRFDYSPALRRARAAGLRWDAARLAAFLDDPEEMFPGLWMGGNGLRDADARDAVASYLRGIAR
jgi:cytochrome c